MNTRQFDYILAVAELKSFGDASEKCFITQSTLSTMIKRFEEEIGISIFDRKTKPITITKEGKLIIEQLKTIRREINNLNELTLHLKGELSSELNIGVIPTVAPYLLPLFLEEMIKEMPQVNFIVNEMTTETIMQKLLTRDLDVGIMAIPINHADLKEITLYDEHFLLYDCSQKNTHEKKTLESLDFSDFWLLSEGHCLRTQVVKLCDLQKQSDKKMNVSFKAGSIESLIRFVKMGKGKTLLPYLSCLDFDKKEKDKLMSLASPVPSRRIGLVVHSHFTKDKIIEKMVAKIKQKVQPLLKEESTFVVDPY